MVNLLSDAPRVPADVLAADAAIVLCGFWFIFFVIVIIFVWLIDGKVTFAPRHILYRMLFASILVGAVLISAIGYLVIRG